MDPATDRASASSTPRVGVRGRDPIRFATSFLSAESVDSPPEDSAPRPHWPASETGTFCRAGAGYNAGMQLRMVILPAPLAILLPHARAQFTQQGNKLVGAGVVSTQQGWSVALSADGNTAVVGGPSDTGAAGAAWIFIRSNGV